MRRLFFLLLPILCLAGEGNFSVPLITQPTPLISFGQLLIGKNALLTEVPTSYTAGPYSDTVLLTPNVVYGILDELSVALFIPINVSSGITYLQPQLEYGFYHKNTPICDLQATVVANGQIPTQKSSSFAGFIGTTFSYTSPLWYAFLSPGFRLGNAQSSSFLYQGGLARYISSLSPPGWIFDLMLEIDGTYTFSSGNLLLATPSIWLSSDRWMVQAGVSFPLTQHPETTWFAITSNIGIGFQF